jgi:hypothetical protein
MSKNYVKIKYQGKVLNILFKSTANLYVLDAECQGAYALENLYLHTMNNNSRVMHKNLYNKFFLSNNCPSTLSSIHVKKLSDSMNIKYTQRTIMKKSIGRIVQRKGMVTTNIKNRYIRAV